MGLTVYYSVIFVKYFCSLFTHRAKAGLISDNKQSLSKNIICLLYIYLFKLVVLDSHVECGNCSDCGVTILNLSRFHLL